MRVLPTDRGPPARGEGEGGRRQWRRIWDPCQSFRVSPLNGLWRRNLLRFLGTRFLGLEDEVLEAPLICDGKGRRSPKSRIGKFMGPCLALPRVVLAPNPSHHIVLCSHSVHRCTLNKSELIRTFPRKLSRWQSSSHFGAASSDGIHLHLSVLIAPSSWYRSHVPNVTHYSPDYLSLRPSSPAAASGPIHAKMSPSFCNCFLLSSGFGP